MRSSAFDFRAPIEYLGDMSTIRPLRKEDLDAVVSIDAALSGRTRRAYFERRLSSALAAPQLFAQYAVEGVGGVLGYALARRMEGEFGRPEAALRLEAIGVRADEQAHGAGTALMEALAADARRHDARELRTTAKWRAHAMLRFLDHAGFSLAKTQLLSRAVALPSSDEEDERPLGEVVLLRAEDIPALVRVDAKRTGTERAGYVRRKVEESLLESSVAVSLGLRHDGTLVGFVTARVDLGDGGRTEPVAVIDTIAVDPAFGRRGVARALLDQLATNLHGLRVEAMETMVAREDFGLLGFLYRAGFGPSERLAFSRPA